MIKKLFILLAGIVLFANATSNVLSQEEFSVESAVTYNVGDNGKTTVSHNITLENNFSTLYATSYTLSLENIKVENVTATDDGGGSLETEITNSQNQSEIKVKFADAVVGRGNQRHFKVTFENNEFATKTGEIWEILIPKLSSNDIYRNYSVALTVPASFGQEAYISPRPYESLVVDQGRLYKFDKESLVKTGVTAGFGEFQVFTFTLNYHLENPLPKSASTEIAVPPDTAFQKVYLRKISPEPKNIRIDADGNWLAEYLLTPRQRLDITVAGNLQVFSSRRSFPESTQETLTDNLKPTEYWQSNDIEIQALANKYKTPRQIYDFVSTTLKYDYDRVKPNIERLGAKGALLSPQSAICMEFTDLFIAIARAAGIPAREVNGYAYTENSKIQPLSLVADVLHSWPEYWDSDKGAWIPIDPTWASTTGGVNFFDKLDLRHFTFVIHGEDSQKPYAPGSYKLGTNPQKDVFVSFGKLDAQVQNYPEIKANLVQNIPFLGGGLNITIKNTGETAFYSLRPRVYFDKKVFNENYIEALPPFSSISYVVDIPYSFLGKNTPNKMRIEVDGTSIDIPVNKTNIIFTSLLGLFSVFIVILAVILWKRYHLTFRKIVEFIPFGRAKPPSTSERQ